MKYWLILILWQSDITARISVISARNQVMGESSMGLLEEQIEFFHSTLLAEVKLICYRIYNEELPDKQFNMLHAF